MDTVIHRLDFSPFFTPEFTYYVPERVLRAWAAGTGCPNATPYSAEEMERVAQDIHNIAATILGRVTTVFRRAVVTAGAPGAGKTSLLASFQDQIPAAYVDCNAVVLHGMALTYGRDIADNPSVEGRKAAYDKWRPAAIAGTHYLIASCVERGFPFCFVSTSSGPQTAGLFSLLKRKDYKIYVIHISASPQVRFASIRQRDGDCMQTTEEEVQVQGDLLPQRLRYTYLPFADKIEFFHRRSADEAPTFAASLWKDDAEEVPATLTVIDQDAYDAVAEMHNEVAGRLGLPTWEESLAEAAIVQED